ncbi:MAG: amidase [Deltaproteobacteria bacterium HGW-Deltaproteobacteria-21]|nr:MAG: amidase [Deltaproteobacteria bacterium HGW-Deltaproteobacteria-21]
MDWYRVTAGTLAEAIRKGEITVEEAVRASLERIRRVDDEVQAWAFLDPEYALDQARRADRLLLDGQAIGPLHGVTVGVKDIFDTADMPTEYGTILHAGRRPAEDATVVALLRQAGAIVLGKTVTTELAVYGPGKTRNPRDPVRTPGGSSSGSAAAVAAEMIPLALGTQTNGSVIRPASYCGVVGYKPTYGTISRRGAIKQSPPLDQVGVFARNVADAALLARALMHFDDGDSAMRPAAQPDLVQAAAGEPPLVPRFAFVKTPVWDQAAEDTRHAFAELCERLGPHVHEVTLPPVFDKAVEWHRTIMEADLAKNFALEYARGKEQLSSILRQMIERGERVTAVEYNSALEQIPILSSRLAEIFTTFDVILTPATMSVAPLGLESTGSPIFCTIWSLCGAPAITLPILRGSGGMPMGAQLVAGRGADARLLRSARWLERWASEGGTVSSMQ